MSDKNNDNANYIAKGALEGCLAGASAGATISIITGSITLPAGIGIGCASGALYGIVKNGTDILNNQYQFMPTPTPACDKSSEKCPDM